MKVFTKKSTKRYIASFLMASFFYGGLSLSTWGMNRDLEQLPLGDRADSDRVYNKIGEGRVGAAGAPAKEISKENTVYILTIDGGGVRGVIPARVLALIEERIAREAERLAGLGPIPEVNLAELVDVIGGTSTGAIIAGALNSRMASNGGKPKKAGELVRFYRENAEIIFPRPGKIQKFKGYFKSQYSQVPLAGLLRDNFGESVWLSSSIADMVIPVYDMRQRMGYVFKSKLSYLDSHNFRTCEALLATTAAPTYFDAVEITSKDGEPHLYSDGGTVANNPVVEALKEVLEDEKHQHKNIYIISLGTGRTVPKGVGDLAGVGKIGYAKQIADMLLENQEHEALRTFDLLKMVIEKQNRTVKFRRINPYIDDSIAALDDASNIQNLIDVGSRVSNERNRDEYPIFIKIIEELTQVYKERKIPPSLS